ncbi:MAG: hypothetical protein KAT58_06250, partial [candidate division Zixibacteria bacterium]|nr:hypothetical protein [candidate division Zixibacteria bacterium]
MNEMKIWNDIKGETEAELNAYLAGEYKAGRLDKLIYDKTVSDVGIFANLSSWMESPDLDRISPHAKRGILAAIFASRWADINEAFFAELAFGTGGIRG